MVRVIAMVLFVAGCGSPHIPHPLQPEKEEKKDKLELSPADVPTPTFYGIHSPDGLTTRPLKFHLDNRFSEPQRQMIRQAMDTWNEAVGFPLLQVTGTTEPSNAEGYGLVADDVSGIYLKKCWSHTGKMSAVLGSTFWENETGTPSRIKSVDIVLNDRDYYLGSGLVTKPDGDPRTRVDLQSLILHELGHAVGLGHAAKGCQHSVMQPNLYVGDDAKLTRKLSEFDRNAIRYIYHSKDGVPYVGFDGSPNVRLDCARPMARALTHNELTAKFAMERPQPQPEPDDCQEY